MKAGRACVNCELSRNGLCKNEFGHAEIQPSRSFQCPFPTCNEGVGKRPVTRRVEDVSRLRMHVSTHVGFVPSTDWLTLTKSRICPGCSLTLTSLDLKCDGCKKSKAPIVASQVPRAQHLPKHKFNRFDQVSLGVTSAALDAGLPELSAVVVSTVSVDSNVSLGRFL